MAIKNKWSKIADYASIRNGKNYVCNSVINGKYPFFDRSKNIKYSDRYLFDEEAIIIPSDGKEFIPKYYKGKFDLHQKCHALYKFRNIDPKYLYYYILANNSKLNKKASGSTVASLSIKEILSFPLLLPELKKQNLVSNLLFKIDQKIETNKKINDNLF
ncbi:restriction endonuclease subunit S [Mycoplasma bradburyae]|uniref:restriction endonuclease subunit S n=1 Tax=Mycoplasma bradburyae TaxID=2963128 RepID=UPI0020CF4A35|nr:restriction endonuclease subunit S [Mycoplasma bradburyae]UTS70978.1 restriction endonuclease subunit S [Mycoplasma bradburyae]